MAAASLVRRNRQALFTLVLHRWFVYFACGRRRINTLAGVVGNYTLARKAGHSSGKLSPPPVSAYRDIGQARFGDLDANDIRRVALCVDLDRDRDRCPAFASDVGVEADHVAD